MKIKNIRDGKKIDSTKFKKYVLTTAAIGIGSFYIWSMISIKNAINDIEEHIEHINEVTEEFITKVEEKETEETIALEDLEERYYKNDLMAIVTNDGEGTPEYHFVKEKNAIFNYGVSTNLDKKESVYVSLTDENLSYPNEEYIHELSESFGGYIYSTIREVIRKNECPVYGGWIPDYKVTNILVHDINNLPLPKEYSKKTYYTLEELKTIEEAMNTKTLNIEEQVKQNTFKKEDLALVYVEDLEDGFLVDAGKCLEVIESIDPYDIYSCEYNFYFESITNPTRGVKIDANVPVCAELKPERCLKELVSLNKEDELLGKSFETSQLIFEDFEEYKDKEELTYEEVVDLENTIRSLLKENNTRILKK